MMRVMRNSGYELEELAHPTSIPNDPTHAFASMGIYLFRTNVLREHLIADAQGAGSHDFGKNIIPQMIRDRRVYAYKFIDANNKDVKYWRDIGTLDAYWEANRTRRGGPPLNLRQLADSNLSRANSRLIRLRARHRAAGRGFGFYRLRRLHLLGGRCKISVSRKFVCRTMQMCVNGRNGKRVIGAHSRIRRASSIRMSSSRPTRKSGTTERPTPGDLPSPNPAWLRLQRE